MPRLIGKQSNNSWSIPLVFILAVAAAGSLEYFGVINVIPGFGLDRPWSNPSSNLPIDRNGEDETMTGLIV
jgi:hypothetical protein